MTGVVARTLCRLALRCLPVEQRSWGRAMCAELDHVDAPGAALAFAAGCLRTGIARRFWDGPTRHLSGRAIVILVGLICAAFHLGCVVSGIAVLSGAQHDPVVLQFMTGAVAPDALGAYREMRPLIVLLIASLGIAHIAVAWQAWRGGLRAFFTAWSIGTLLAILLVGCIIIFARSTEGVVIQLAGLMVQAVAVLWLIQPNLPRPLMAVSDDRKVMQ